MWKKSGILILIAVVMLIISVSGFAFAQGTVSDKNKASIGAWAENPEIKVKVTKVEEITDWSKFPFNKRFVPAREKEFERLKKEVESGEAKFVMVTVEAKNITGHKLNIGYYTVPASPGDFWIRGDEGSEQSSAQKNSFYKDIKTRSAVLESFKLPTYIQGGFPMNAKISPGGSTSGKMMFLVPSWFTPTVFFKKVAKLKDKKFEIIIKLK